MAALDQQTLDLLDQILREKFPKVRSRLAKIGLAGLDSHVRRELTDAFAAELLGHGGFDSNWERTAKGRALEELISLVCVNEDPEPETLPLVSSDP